MISRARLVVLTITLTATAAAARADSPPQAPPKPAVTVLRAARMLDVKRGTMLRDAAVVVEGATIRAAGAGVKTPEALTLDDVPALLAALRPMLRTLIGAEACEEFLAEIRQELVI